MGVQAFTLKGKNTRIYCDVQTNKGVQAFILKGKNTLMHVLS